jgi:phage terminase large subunit-like protein
MKKILSKIWALCGFKSSPLGLSGKVFIDIDAWDRCASTLDWPDLRGRRCFGGLHVGYSFDSSCLVLCFPPSEDDYSHRVLVRYLPLYRSLDGFKESARRWADIYRIEKVGFDPWEATSITCLLEEIGIFTVAVQQGFSVMSAPLKKLREMVLRGELAHDGDVSLRKAVSRFVVAMSPSEAIEPAASKDCGAFLALAIALATSL